ncbi:MBL fold metallo-hydrolase [Hyphobacterium marinum]|uniref:MBL fold metallo-hydrolase n=1 Tax=Hyphobacterium marinum TaxID=3116574 RepID=A0ABU7LZ45_9PROT|nr:MBL fold metallo-hydrolase [Hyphobacterium sp. Y6023]MEE2566814.1 MBL fold metallo-hydrolase [Hyphobacterium sp. Y6023]
MISILASLLLATSPETCPIELVVLGTAQDGGSPQMGQHADPAWTDASERRLTVSLGLVNHDTRTRFLFEATPDIRTQFRDLDAIEAGDGEGPVLDGVFLTHAHIGHYTGLMFLGHESMGAQGVPVFALPRMAEFLRTNGPWSQLVTYGNIDLRETEADDGFGITDDVMVRTFTVPHRQEFSEVAGFRIDGPNRSAIFIPDIDSWEEWEAEGVDLDALIASVDLVFIDATFYANGEMPGRDMSGFPHPFVTHSMERFAHLPLIERAKIQFIHVNHTNPIRFTGSPESRAVEEAGYGIARRGDRHCL